MTPRTQAYYEEQRLLFIQEEVCFNTMLVYKKYYNIDDKYKKELLEIQAQLPNEVIDSDLLFLIFKSLRDANPYYQNKDKIDYDHLFLEEAILVTRNDFYIHYRAKINELQGRMPFKVYTPELKQFLGKLKIQ